MGDRAPELQQAQGQHGEAWVAGVTARAPSNIAVIKYWGKRDERLILPLNSSLSATLDCRDLAAQTTVAASPAFDKDRLWLNGKEVSLDTHRYQACLSALRARATSVTTTAWPLAYLRQLPQQQLPERSTDGGDSHGGDSNRDGGSSNAGFEVTVTVEQWRKPVHVHIVSHNNFPTAAGLASSAAGFACLVFSVARLMGVEESFPGELTTLARLGSGSACRSLYGGFVRWNRGELEDGSDSTAEQVAPQNHWPELAIIVAVVNDEKKDVSSTGGMKRSVETSQLLHFRAKEVVPQRMCEMEAAIAARNFNAFARLTCADSNQFHATCLDTQPPIFYLNHTSRQIIELVERWNAEDGVAKAAYTFDAGPNAVLFVEGEANAKELMTRLLSRFPPLLPLTSTNCGHAADDDQELQHRLRSLIVGSSDVTSKLREVAANFVRQGADQATQREDSTSAIRYFICTNVGEGPHLVSEGDRDAHLATLAGVCQLSSS